MKEKTKIMFLLHSEIKFYARYLNTILENHFYNPKSPCSDQAKKGKWDTEFIDFPSRSIFFILMKSTYQ